MTRLTRMSILLVNSHGNPIRTKQPKYTISVWRLLEVHWCFCLHDLRSKLIMHDAKHRVTNNVKMANVDPRSCNIMVSWKMHIDQPPKLVPQNSWWFYLQIWVASCSESPITQGQVPNPIAVAPSWTDWVPRFSLTQHLPRQDTQIVAIHWR